MILDANMRKTLNATLNFIQYSRESLRSLSSSKEYMALIKMKYPWFIVSLATMVSKSNELGNKGVLCWNILKLFSFSSDMANDIIRRKGSSILPFPEKVHSSDMANDIIQ